MSCCLSCASGNNCPPPPYLPLDCPAPPYNAPQNPNFATNAQRYPSFPFNTGSNFSQLISSQASNAIFTNVNNANQAIKATGTKTQPYVMFKSNQERILYMQAQIQAQSRQMAMTYGTETGNLPAFATPTRCQVCNNLFSIINDGPTCTA